LIWQRKKSGERNLTSLLIIVKLLITIYESSISNLR
jgi:hypothetical protein